MSKQRIWRSIVIAFVLIGLTAWVLGQHAAAQSEKAIATFVTKIAPNLVTQTQPVPQVRLEMVASAQVGDWVTAQLIATNVYDLAGFQVELRFDEEKLGFGTAVPIEGFAAARDLISMGYVRHEGVVRLGAASCPTIDCTSASYEPDPKLVGGVSGTVELATFEFQVRQGGVATLEIAAVTLVDVWGDTILTGDQTALPDVIKPSLTSLDLSGNNQINDADAYLVVSAWRELQRTERCLADSLTSYDIDGNGCLSIADIQIILAAWGEQPISRSGISNNYVPSATFTVNSSGDQSDVNPGDGICRTALLNCTLRAALEEANARPGSDTIQFNIRNTNGSCPSLVTIEPNSALIVDAADNNGIMIDGYSQCNASVNSEPIHGNAIIKIELRGDNDEFIFGLHILSPNNLVQGLAIYNWHRQIQLLGERSHDNVVQGNFIGTNAANTFTQSASGIEGDGIRLEIGANHNLVGGTAPSARNIVSGNDQDGVGFQGAGVDFNTIINNYVGLKQSGDTRLRNGTDGVDVAEGAANNQFGGLNPGERNVVSGNNGDGIEISHDTGTVGNEIVGNFIGLAAAGTITVYNSDRGITLEDSVGQNLIYRNVIVANGGDGVRFYTVFNNQLYDNFIGAAPVGLGPYDVVPLPTVKTELTALPNGTSGGSQGLSGVYITAGSQSNQITHNIIAYHPQYGIYLDAQKGYLSYGTCEAYYNTFSQNNLFDNAANGIRLKSGICDDGIEYFPNQGIETPVIISAIPWYVTGTTCPNCLVQVFIADKPEVNNPNGDNFGEGKVFLTEGLADVNGYFWIQFANVANGTILTAYTTDRSGNSSEFARNAEVIGSSGQGRIFLPLVSR